jgi:hypothetical protein
MTITNETKSIILLIIGIASIMFGVTLFVLHPFIFGYSPYCEYDEAYCITGKPDPDLTQREIQYYCMLLDDSDRPPFCFKETLDFTYRMTPYLNEETRVLAVCIHSDLIIPKCERMYGGPNSTYGEQIN